MKNVLFKIALAASILFLLPSLSMGQSLKGIWRLDAGDNTSQEATRYKVFDKEGNYYNVDAFHSKAVDIRYEMKDQSLKDPLIPCQITRSGKYDIVSKGLYSENLRYEYGRNASAVIPISYRIKGDKMILLFQLGKNVYREIYKKVPAIGR